jgi:hypothetical protein
MNLGHEEFQTSITFLSFPLFYPEEWQEKTIAVLSSLHRDFISHSQSWRDKGCHTWSKLRGCSSHESSSHGVWCSLKLTIQWPLRKLYCFEVPSLFVRMSLIFQLPQGFTFFLWHSTYMLVKKCKVIRVGWYSLRQNWL